MDAKEFIESIRIIVVEASIKSVKDSLSSPAGKNPSPQLLELSKWFNQLDEENKTLLLKVVSKSVETSVFGFLCVLDGVRAFESGEDKGGLELYYTNNGSKQLLNNPADEYLHDLFS